MSEPMMCDSIPKSTAALGIKWTDRMHITDQSCLSVIDMASGQEVAVLAVEDTRVAIAAFDASVAAERMAELSSFMCWTAVV